MHNHLTHCFSKGLVNYDIHQLLFTYKCIDDPEVRAFAPEPMHELPVCSIIIGSIRALSSIVLFIRGHAETHGFVMPCV